MQKTFAVVLRLARLWASPERAGILYNLLQKGWAFSEEADPSMEIKTNISHLS